VLTCGDQLSTTVAESDRDDIDLFADDGAWAWEMGVFVEGVLDSCERLVFVVAVDRDLLDEAAGADYGRKATKWRCPTGECQPASVWVKADRLHPLIPRETLRFKGLYRNRGAVEREFGRLKNEWALSPLRVRGIERVRLHADLTILAKLGCALTQARALPLAA